MKKNRHLTYGIALSQYKRYKRKYQKLFLDETTNTSKLEFLKKRIARLFEFLMERVKIAKLVAAGGALGLLLVAPNAKAQSFSLAAKDTFSLVQTGTFSTPTFVDLDGDGKIDMVSGSRLGDLYIFANTGTNTAPIYATGTNVGNLGTTFIAPTFADLDGDGDKDLMIGEYGGNFLYAQNTGTATVANFPAFVTNPFGLAKTSYITRPFFVDLDNDGDLDMMSGDYTGNFYYFQNTGTASAPAFAAAQTNPFGLTDIGKWSSVSLADIDLDGDLDLFAGEYSGSFFYFKNTGTASAPAFAAAAQDPFDLAAYSYLSTTAFADVDNDGDLDLMSGDYAGDFYYFEQCTPPAPTNPVTQTICNGTTATISATVTGTIGWYDAATGGNWISAASSFTTPVLTANATYYAQDSSATCGKSIKRTAITVTVNAAIDNTTSLSGATITANQTSATYRWLDCNASNAVVAGQTGQNYTLTANGSYAVEITVGSCVDTSACVTIANVGINEYSTQNGKLSVYPNPNNGTFTLQTKSAGEYKIVNVLGQTIQTFKLNATNNFSITIENLNVGIYFIVENASNAKQKIVVTK